MNKIKLLIWVLPLIFITLTPLQSAQIPVEKQFNYAEALFDSHQYKSALDEYMKIICLYPDNDFKDDAQFKIAECILGIKKFSYTEKDVPSTTLELTGGDGDMWFALKEWQKLVDKYPNSSLVSKAKENIRLAKICLQNTGEPTETGEENHVVSRMTYFLNFFRWSSIYDGGNGYVYNSEYKNEALYWCDRIIAEYPNSSLVPPTMMVKASIYTEQKTKKDYLLAVEEYQKIIDKYPDSYLIDRALATIGDIYENNLNNRRAAIEAYQKIIDRNKSDPLNYYCTYADAQLKYYK